MLTTRRALPRRQSSVVSARRQSRTHPCPSKGNMISGPMRECANAPTRRIRMEVCAQQHEMQDPTSAQQESRNQTDALRHLSGTLQFFGDGAGRTSSQSVVTRAPVKRTKVATVPFDCRSDEVHAVTELW